MPLLIQTLGPGGNGPNVVSRPFVLGLLLLLLFLSTQTDWSPAARRQRMEIRAGLASGSLQKQEIMREKLLYELTTSNEKLEKENMRLRQTVMLLNRAIRSCIGCNISSLLPFQPFLDDEIQQLLPSAEAQQQQEGQEAGTTLGGGVVEEEAKAEGNTGKQVEAQGDEQHGILSQETGIGNEPSSRLGHTRERQSYGLGSSGHLRDRSRLHGTARNI